MTTLREAAQQALEALEWYAECSMVVEPAAAAMTALRAALEQYDKDRVKIEEMKANWALQRKLAEETQERDKQRMEYEAALADGDNLSPTEPVQEPVAFAHINGTSDTKWHPPQRKPLTEERNFCPRCGKRTQGIHTCTPPGDCDVHG